MKKLTEPQKRFLKNLKLNEWRDWYRTKGKWNITLDILTKKGYLERKGLDYRKVKDYEEDL